MNIIRPNLIGRLKTDLMGPGHTYELLIDRPSDRYLTGILFPQSREPDTSNDEDLSLNGVEEAPVEQSPPLSATLKPSTIGISFALSVSGKTPEIAISVRLAKYQATWLDTEGKVVPELQRRGRPQWIRKLIRIKKRHVQLSKGHSEIDLSPDGATGAVIYLRVIPWSGGLLATAALINRNKPTGDTSRNELEEMIYFQVRLGISPEHGTRLVPRPSRGVDSDADPDTRLSNLIYRNINEYAVGHTCSATWRSRYHVAQCVATTWIPATTVHATSSEGSPLLSSKIPAACKPFSAGWLSMAPREELERGLNAFLAGYEAWIDQRHLEAKELQAPHQITAFEQIGVCKTALKRMRDGALFVSGKNGPALDAFRLANRAMVLQRGWSAGSADLTWRPFQLAFLLLTIESTVSQDPEMRDLMDLLWFPTGGGKTEAYLALTAFVLIYRRLSNSVPDNGAGVAVLMRYTLRLLTIQQFQRATALILACELIRVELKATGNNALGEKAFSIGLWVGGGATPNSFDEATKLGLGNECTPAQIHFCPCCHKQLHWALDRGRETVVVRCTEANCALAKSIERFPIWTVDTDIYRERPSLIIGTVDKFAQIVRKPQTGAIFSVDSGSAPPSLIIQDELHLISGPLGTISAIYEVAIDRLCTVGRLKPKIIGSTATIRRARDQVRSLFNREAFQFPPPGLWHGDSGFAVLDRLEPGRRYYGVTTAGRSPKFVLQAVTASMSQASWQLQGDTYWSLVGYFNSLRELGGALVLMQDDVPNSIYELAARYDEQARELRNITELTSREREIPVILNQLQFTRGNPDSVDILLASNMISVGVDIPRLNIMIVNGQPKTIAEYIQATSRVGRSEPGIVVAIYNNSRVRDRAHYETFSTWHRQLYRQVEATSVTPFASRARDKALHAIVVTFARHLVSGMKDNPALTAQSKSDLEKLCADISARVKEIDPEELDSVRREIQQILDDWETRSPALTNYWIDQDRNHSLLMSAELSAALEAAGRQTGDAWSTPNSMRDVEPGVEYFLREKI